MRPETTQAYQIRQPDQPVTQELVAKGIGMPFGTPFGLQFWQQGLILLAVLWACQAAGTWMQMRHYGQVMRGIAQSWPDGCVGSSAARGTFGRGVVAIVVASPDHVVRQVFLMEGRSVFAKFHPVDVGAGVSLAALAERVGQQSKARQKAVAGAVSQIDARWEAIRRETGLAAPLAA